MIPTALRVANARQMQIHCQDCKNCDTPYVVSKREDGEIGPRQDVDDWPWHDMGLMTWRLYEGVDFYCTPCYYNMRKKENEE